MKKKCAMIAIGMSLVLGMGLSATAEKNYTPGVTVTADETSATGYTVTFVYEDADAEKVELSGSFAFYTDDGTRGAEPEEFTTPYDWEDGMFALGQETYKEEMKKVDGTDYWVVEMPLPSGHYQYAFYIDDSEERVDDPTNPGCYANVENGGAYTRSTVDVPWDAEKQKNSQDYYYAAPMDEEESGSLTFVNYEDVDGNMESLGIYLPNGYDKNDEEYRVLYLSHGGGGDETFWYGGGAAAEIFDHLIAEEKLEPTVVVTMNNTTYDWDFDKIIDNTVNHIIPYVEENYHVAVTADKRAFAGLSMGGLTTSHMLYDATDYFDYYGIFSGADASVDLKTCDLEKIDSKNIMVGVGIYDMAYTNESYGTDEDRTVQGFVDNLNENEVPFSYHEVEGGHEWFTWMQLLRIFGTETLWK